jgi:hypothetical protein
MLGNNYTRPLSPTTAQQKSIKDPICSGSIRELNEFYRSHTISNWKKLEGL